MDKHYGQIVELVIRKGGYSISELARLSGLNRKSIYNWFNQKYLKTEIIYRIGVIIKHDFSVEFPELFTKEDFERADGSNYLTNKNIITSLENVKWKDKYIDLLEKYNEMLLDRMRQDVGNGSSIA